jgi:hypothetical protein
MPEGEAENAAEGAAAQVDPKTGHIGNERPRDAILENSDH